MSYSYNRMAHRSEWEPEGYQKLLKMRTDLRGRAMHHEEEAKKFKGKDPERYSYEMGKVNAYTDAANALGLIM